METGSNLCGAEVTNKRYVKGSTLCNTNTARIARGFLLSLSLRSGFPNTLTRHPVHHADVACLVQGEYPRGHAEIVSPALNA